MYLVFTTELYKAFNPIQEPETKTGKQGKGDSSVKNKRIGGAKSKRKPAQNNNRNRTTNNNRKKRNNNSNEFSELLTGGADKNLDKGFSLSSVFSSLHNIQHQINMKQRSPEETSFNVAKLKQVRKRLFIN